MTNQKIYFMQHGLAVDKAMDPERPLSETGIQQTEMMADALRNSETQISSVFHSGKLRASQTADIITTISEISPASVINGLSPNDDATLLAQNLNIDDALYVGHLPHLDKMVSYLVTGNRLDSIIKFQNSAILCLENNEDRYHILWYLTHDLLNNSLTDDQI